jgi:hypothetical protein
MYFIVFLFGAVLGFSIARIGHMFEGVGGKRYFQSEKTDVIELRRFVYQALPAKNALDAWIAANKKCPERIDELPNLPQNYASDCFGLEAPGPEWFYSHEGSTYHLRMKLNWDGGISYDSDEEIWKYSDAASSWQVFP